MSRLRWIAVLGAAVLLTACSGSAASDVTDEALTAVPTIAEATSAPTEIATAEPEAATAEISEEVTVAADVGKRDAPIAPDAGFHNDAATVFAATGKPQLMEAFAYW